MLDSIEYHTTRAPKFCKPFHDFLNQESLVIKQSQYFIRNIKKEEKDWHEKEPPKIQTPVRWLSSIISNYHSSRLHAGFNQLTIFSWLLLTLFAFKVAKNTILKNTNEMNRSNFSGNVEFPFLKLFLKSHRFVV